LRTRWAGTAALYGLIHRIETTSGWSLDSRWTTVDEVDAGGRLGESDGEPGAGVATLPG